MRPIIVMSCGVNEERTAFSGSLSYVRAIEAAGGSVITIAPIWQEESQLAKVCDLANGILLPGGWDVDPSQFGEESVPANGRVDPEVDELDLCLARYALWSGKPLLGICRGCQVLNVATDGSLYQDLPSQFDRKGLLQHRQLAPRWHGTHQVMIAQDSLLAAVMGENTLRVNSFHHQAVQTTGQTTRIVAQAADGVVEGIEVHGHPFAIGVQWHPEGMVDRHFEQRRLFDAFVQAAM